MSYSGTHSPGFNIIDEERLAQCLELWVRWGEGAQLGKYCDHPTKCGLPDTRKIWDKDHVEEETSNSDREEEDKQEASDNNGKREHEEGDGKKDCLAGGESESGVDKDDGEGKGEDGKKDSVAVVNVEASDTPNEEAIGTESEEDSDYDIGELASNTSNEELVADSDSECVDPDSDSEENQIGVQRYYFYAEVATYCDRRMAKGLTAEDLLQIEEKLGKGQGDILGILDSHPTETRAPLFDVLFPIPPPRLCLDPFELMLFIATCLFVWSGRRGGPDPVMSLKAACLVTKAISAVLCRVHGETIPERNLKLDLQSKKRELKDSKQELKAARKDCRAMKRSMDQKEEEIRSLRRKLAETEQRLQGEWQSEANSDHSPPTESEKHSSHGNSDKRQFTQTHQRLSEESQPTANHFIPTSKS